MPGLRAQVECAYGSSRGEMWNKSWMNAERGIPAMINTTTYPTPFNGEYARCYPNILLGKIDLGPHRGGVSQLHPVAQTSRIQSVLVVMRSSMKNSRPTKAKMDFHPLAGFHDQPK